MRVLVTSTPGWGHVHPLIPLARALRDRGDDVLVTVAADAARRLSGDGLDVSPAGLSMSESHTELTRRFPEIESLRPPALMDAMFPGLFGSVRAEPMLHDLLPIAAEFRPDLIIHEAGELAAPLVARIHQLPNVVMAFGAIIPPHRMQSASERVAPLWERHGFDVPAFAGCYEHVYLDIYPASLSPAGSLDHVRARQPLRPVASVTDDAAADAGTALPPGGDPLVYVTLGTVFNQNAAVFRAALDALRDLPVRVLVTVGPQGDPALLGDVPDRVRVERYVPHTDVLPHCAAVVSHAGSGTFLGSLALGIPQVCVPQAADQFRNAESAVGSGAGLALLPGEVTSASVRQAVERVLADDSFRRAASRIGDEIAAMPSPDEVATILAQRFGCR